MSEILRQKWTQLGVGFHATSLAKTPVDLEKTIIETVAQAKFDSRLLFGMRGWLLKHHDLVNVNRLSHFVKKQSNTAVLGALLDSIVQQHPHSSLKSVKKYCHKLKKPEFVFKRIADSKVESQINRQTNLNVWKKWNLISNEMDDLKGAIFEKPYVFKHNPNLALRAVFGPNIRAEIMAFFLYQNESNALALSRVLHQSYQPVYAELKKLTEIGISKCKKVGASKLFKIDRRVVASCLKLVSG